MIDFRSLFNEARVEWRDRGPNTSKGNVNIACPFCRHDPSMHMAVSDEKEAYYCYRNPNQHAGGNIVRLLMAACRISRHDAIRLIAAHTGGQRSALTPRIIRAEAGLLRGWDRFNSAKESAACVAYLRQRGFASPLATIDEYGLRYATEGRWALRLLLPLFDIDGALVSWVGRAIVPHLRPKYMMQDQTLEGLLYIPRAIRRNLVLVEGPIDALATCTACADLPITAIALTGKAMQPAKMVRLKNIFMEADQIFLALDADVALHEQIFMLRGLASLARGRYIKRLGLPAGYKDAAEINADTNGPAKLRAWLKGAIKNDNDTALSDGDAKITRGSRTSLEWRV